MAKSSGVYPLWAKSRNGCFIKPTYVREPLGEFFGTLVLCLIAVGAGMAGGFAQVNVLAKLGGALGLFVAILLVGGVSGGHVNPAVTLALCVGGRCSWFKLPLFWLVQYLGGFVGALAGGGLYKHRSGGGGGGNSGNGTGNGTSSQGASGVYCANFSFTDTSTTLLDGFLCETVMSIVFIMGLFSLIDRHNMLVPKHHIPIFLALIFGTISFTFGDISGTHLNPARDLMGRIAALVFGCSSKAVFKNKGGGLWLLVGSISPFVGAVIGALLYILLIGAQDGPHPASRVAPNKSSSKSKQKPKSTRRKKV